MKIKSDLLHEIKRNFEHTQNELDLLKKKINAIINLYYTVIFIAFLSLLISVIR